MDTCWSSLVVGHVQRPATVQKPWSFDPVRWKSARTHLSKEGEREREGRERERGIAGERTCQRMSMGDLGWVSDSTVGM